MTTELFKLTLAFRGLSDEEEEEPGVADPGVPDEDDDEDNPEVVVAPDADEDDSMLEG